MSEQPAPSAAVRLRGLRKEFGSGSHPVVAVDGVDLDVNDGEFITLLGPSGSGKTTVLRMIAGHMQSQKFVAIFFHEFAPVFKSETAIALRQ